jgi:hypothetical protein
MFPRRKRCPNSVTPSIKKHKNGMLEVSKIFVRVFKPQLLQLSNPISLHRGNLQFTSITPPTHQPAQPPPSPQPAASPPHAKPHPHPPPPQAPAPPTSPHSAPLPPTPPHLQPQTPSDPEPSAIAAAPRRATPREYQSPPQQTHSPCAHRTNRSHQRLHLPLTPYTKRRPLMNSFRLDIQNPPRTISRHPTRLLRNKRQRVRLI